MIRRQPVSSLRSPANPAIRRPSEDSHVDTNPIPNTPTIAAGPSPPLAPRRVGKTDVQRIENAKRTFRALDYQYGGACHDAVVTTSPAGFGCSAAMPRTWSRIGSPSPTCTIWLSDGPRSIRAGPRRPHSAGSAFVIAVGPVPDTNVVLPTPLTGEVCERLFSPDRPGCWGAGKSRVTSRKRAEGPPSAGRGRR